MFTFVPTKGVSRGIQPMATPQTPRDIREQTGGPTFAPTKGISRGIQPIQPAAQPTLEQPTQQEIIQGGVQQAEQGRFAPEIRLGIFTAPDVFARKIASGQIKETEGKIIDDSIQHIELINRLIEETDDPTIKQRRTANLARFIQDTNNLLQDDIFQLPSNLQLGAAVAETALDIAPVPAFGLLRGAKLGTRLGFESVERAGKAIGGKVVERGVIRAPVTAGRAAINQSIFGGALGGTGATLAGIQETGDVTEGLKRGAIGLPLGAAFGAALPLTGRLLQPIREKILRPQEIQSKPFRWMMQKLGSPLKNVIGSTGEGGSRLRTIAEKAREEGGFLGGKLMIGKDKFLPIYNQLDEAGKRNWFNIVAKEANFGLSPEEVIAREGITDITLQDAIKSFFNDITKPLSEVASRTGTEYRGGALLIEAGRQIREIVRTAGKPGVFMPRTLTGKARRELLETGKDKAIKQIADTDPRISKMTDADKKQIAARKKFDALTPDDQRVAVASRARTQTLNTIDDYTNAGLETDIVKIIDEMIDRDAAFLGLQSVMSDTSNPIVKSIIDKLKLRGEPIITSAGKIKLPAGNVSYNFLEDTLVSDFDIARLTAREIVDRVQKKAGFKTVEETTELVIKNKKIALELLEKELALPKGKTRARITEVSNTKLFDSLPAHRKVNKVLQELYDDIGQETAKKFNESERLIIDKMARNYVNKQFFSLPFDESGLVSGLKQIQAAKLSTSFVANSTQLLATLMATDLPTLSKAFLKTFRGIDGKNLVKRAGIIQDSAIRRELGGKYFKGYQKFLDKWLALFKWTENSLNRAVTGNAGAIYGAQLFKIGKLDELGKILSKDRIKKAVGRGYLDEEDLMSSARGLVTNTQFGWNPADYPELWSTPWGSVIVQFKSFIYRQMLLILDETAGEFAAGRAGKAQKNMMIILTMYPAAGHVIKSFNNFIAGRPTNIDEMNIGKYFEDIASSGGFGMGVEFLESIQDNRGLEFMLGPTGSFPVSVLENIIDQGLDLKGQGKNIVRETTAQFGGVGRFLGRQLIEGVE